MKEILIKSQELLGLVEQKNKQLDNLIEKNRVEATQHEAEARRLNEVKQDLARREARVSGIEDLLKLKNEAIALRGKAEKAMEDLKKEEERFNRASEQKTAQIIADEKANFVENKRLKDKEKFLNDDRARLEVDKGKVKEAMNKLGIK